MNIKSCISFILRDYNFFTLSVYNLSLSFPQLSLLFFVASAFPMFSDSIFFGKIVHFDENLDYSYSAKDCLSFPLKIS